MKTMSKLQNKIDFVVFISVTNANSNGDPLNGNGLQRFWRNIRRLHQEKNQKPDAGYGIQDFRTVG